MLSVLLMILKVLGIIILILLGTILTFALLVLFVPVRYRIMVHRKTQEEIPISVKIKATWFWHVINAVFSYPEAAFLRVRLFCFTIFRSDKANDATESSEDKEKKKKVSEAELPASKPLVQEQEHEKEAVSQAENESETVGEKQFGADNRKHKKNHAPKKKGLLSKFVEFFRKLWSVIKNIKYTILKICDKKRYVPAGMGSMLKAGVFLAEKHFSAKDTGKRADWNRGSCQHRSNSGSLRYVISIAWQSY